MHTALSLPSPVRKVKFHRKPPHWVEISGEIYRTLAFNFSDDLKEACHTGQSIIPVVIHSPGGDVSALKSILDTIRQCRMPVAMILTGVATNAAVAILTCGHPTMRFIAPSATIMFHGVSDNMFGPQKAGKADAAEVMRLNSLLCKEMSRNTGHHEHFFEEFLTGKQNVDVRMSAQEAVELGIADHIGMPVLVNEFAMKTSLHIRDGSNAFSLSVDGSADLSAVSRCCKRRFADDRYDRQPRVYDTYQPVCAHQE